MQQYNNWRREMNVILIQVDEDNLSNSRNGPNLTRNDSQNSSNINNNRQRRVIRNNRQRREIQDNDGQIMAAIRNERRRRALEDNNRRVAEANRRPFSLLDCCCFGLGNVNADQ